MQLYYCVLNVYLMNDLFTYEYMLSARVRLLKVVSVNIWFTRFVPRKNSPELTFMSTLYVYVIKLSIRPLYVYVFKLSIRPLYVYVIKLSIRPLRRMQDLLIYLCIPVSLCECVRDKHTRPAAGVALGM